MILLYLKQIYRFTWWHVLNHFAEITASFVIILVGFYIYTDFTQVKLAEIVFPDAFINFLITIIILILGIIAGHTSFTSKPAISNFLNHLNVNGLQFIKIAEKSLIPLICLNLSFYFDIPPSKAFTLFLIGFIVSVLNVKIPGIHSANSILKRTYGVFFTNKASRLMMLLLILLFHYTSFSSDIAYFVVGIILANIYVIQIGEEAKMYWVEKYSGISHNKIERIHTLAAWLIGTICICLFLPQSIKQFFLLIGPVCIVPHIIFQIDPKSRFANIILISVIGILFSTAIYINKFSMLLYPLIAYYGSSMQKGHFYRA